ncbi:CDP-glycerol glycerophosphotransferase family protein [Pantoea sp. USHLN256]|uniref:CDP-glycerol glycerophosphotransferase family protein n=1 Tax=Pantoea sp. USHLN256 TaxID=3081293 RepID=UPI00301A8950
MILKKRMVRLVKRVLSLINYLIPKNNTKVVFKSRPDFSGNARALYEYININHKDKYKLVWITDGSTKLPIDATVVNSGSLSALKEYVTAKYIVTTHNEMIGIKSANQSYISLWHGMPLKKICYLGEYDHEGMEDYSSYRIASSELMRSIISACFREKANNVFITGQPRNDYLFDMIKSNGIFESINKNKKIILYMPTFRENQEALNYSDGKGINCDNFLRVDDFELEIINRFLMENNAHLVIKLHPYEEKALVNIDFGTNITLMTTSILRKHDMDVNHLMARANILISDYSSAYFDFMMLNRPMVFLIPDVEAYSSSRGGFTLEPVSFWMPGAHVDTLHALLDELDKLLSGNDRFEYKRKEICEIINLHKDKNNSERVFRQFFK